MLAELPILICKKGKPSKGEARSKNEEERGKDAADTPNVETYQAVAVIFEPQQNVRRNEKARDHEEDVYPDEPTPDPVGEGVKSDDGQDGECPQSIDVG